jgi:hypothetical protein
MIRPMRTFLSLAAVALLVACASRPEGSYVGPLQQTGDAEALAGATAEFVADRLPAASSTVMFDPTPRDQAGNTVTAALVVALRRRGFAVADTGQKVPAGAHRLRYLVTPMDNGTLLRLTIDENTRGSRFFVRDAAGRLRSGGPYTITLTGSAP